MLNRLLSNDRPASRTLTLMLLAVLVGLAAWLLQPWGAPSPLELGRGLQSLWQEQRGLSLAVLIGVEASAWLHLIQDGDPLPVSYTHLTLPTTSRV